ncbi:hypothetical protein [Paraliobacillus quinghaiensis]|nr:hypothetical protein [Paraliobacillus quinghaiensis]
MYVEIPSLLKQKAFKDLAAFITILLIAIVLSTIHFLDITIPTPMDAIETIYKPLSNFFASLLK